MRIDEAMNKLIDQCKIFYKKECISGERIVKDYLHFFSKTFNLSEKRTSFCMNTGSVVFDIVATVATVISSLGYNENTNDDIISSLKEGNIVLYNNKRYRWAGLQQDNGKCYMVLVKDNGEKTFSSYEKNKHLIKEYHGQSQTTDGRGIKKGKSNREDFFAFLYNVGANDIPSAIDASFVFVADKGFDEILKNVSIEYDGKNVKLLELVACSYYTSGLEEIIIGKNPSKKEPVIKLTSHISVARQIALSKEGNNTAGIIVCTSGGVSNDNSELNDLIGRKKIRFVHYMTKYDTSVGEYIVREYTNSSVFACTPSYLKGTNTISGNDSKLLDDLHRQMYNLANLSINEVVVGSGISFKMLKTIRNDIFALKDSVLDDDNKNDFLINIYTLQNLFLTAPFDLIYMEECVSENKLHHGVMSPKERIGKLEEHISLFDNAKTKAKEVLDCIKQEYKMLVRNNPKQKALDEIIRKNIKKRIVVVVPKSYYIDVLKSTSIFGINTSNVYFKTTKEFSPEEFYDVVIVVSNKVSDKFKIFECCSTSQMYVILHEAENMSFMLKKKKARVFEGNIYKKHMKYSYVIDDAKERAEINDNIETQEAEEVENGWNELSEFIDNLKFKVPMQYTYNSGTKLVSDTGTALSEVSYVGMFETGESIYLSKYYSAVVYDGCSIEEKKPEKLQSGDVLVFTRNDNYTKNIVDYIFDELLEKNKLNASVKEANQKAEKWKELLRAYKDNGDYSYRDVTDSLNKLGLKHDEVTVRQWIYPESHIVGPRSMDDIRIIGELVNDDDLKNNYTLYDDAFKIVRKQRRNILGLIFKAINEKLSGRRSSGDEIIQMVFDNVDRLSQTYELESIKKVDEQYYIPIGYANRPIDSEDD